MEERHVVTCFLEHAGRILLLRRSGRVSTYRGRWAGVSGTVEPGRTPLEQAWTEIREEIGLQSDGVALVAAGEPLVVIDKALGRRWVVHPFRFAVRHPETIQTDWEHVEARWVSPTEIGQYETVPKLTEAWSHVAGPAQSEPPRRTERQD